jgi:hypothetical protein
MIADFFVSYWGFCDCSPEECILNSIAIQKVWCMTTNFMNRIKIYHRFETRRCMNFHHDIVLKTIENNNAMRWWKTLKASQITSGFVNGRCDATVTEPPQPVRIAILFDNRWHNGGTIIVCEITSVHGTVSVHTPLPSNIFTTVHFKHRLLPQPTVSFAQVDVNGISATNVVEVELVGHINMLVSKWWCCSYV